MDYEEREIDMWIRCNGVCGFVIYDKLYVNLGIIDHI